MELVPEPQATVIPFPLGRQVERIGGVRINLGRMSTQELTTLEVHCVERYEDAQLELLIVRDALEMRLRGETPDGGDAA